MYSQGNFVITMKDEKGNNVIDSELSPYEVIIVDEIGKVTIINMKLSSSNPIVLRDKNQYILKIVSEDESVSTYDVGLFSSRLINGNLEATFLVCPVNNFATKYTKNLGENIHSSISNIDKYFILNTSKLDPINLVGKFYQLNMTNLDTAIELAKGVAPNTIVCYNNGELIIRDVSGIPEINLGTIPKNIDFYNIPYLYSSFSLDGNEKDLSLHKYRGYQGFSYYNYEYYKNYFSNIKYYESSSFSFRMTYNYKIAAKVGTYVSAVFDSVVCNSLIVTKYVVIYKNNKVTSEITVGDLRNELRVNE